MTDKQLAAAEKFGHLFKTKYRNGLVGVAGMTVTLTVSNNMNDTYEVQCALLDLIQSFHVPEPAATPRVWHQ